jgi:hypothetical protein
MGVKVVLSDINLEGAERGAQAIDAGIGGAQAPAGEVDIADWDR